MKVSNKLIIFLLLFSSSAHAKALCFKFDLTSLKPSLQNAKQIDDLVLYPSMMFGSDEKNTTTYFVDHGVHKNPDAYNLVQCKAANSYLNCSGEDDSALFGIFIDKSKASLHLNFIVLSDLDEPLRVLKAAKSSTISIPGHVFKCPKESPEAKLF